MPGTLHVVATPIGNLEDVTYRAVRILGEVALIAAEDTRRTATLLRHYGIQTRTTSYHEHNERQKLESILSRLRKGDSVALVSDAGTPLVSDPGGRLVRAALDEGLRVEAIPGPSAVMTALVSAGFMGDSFTFVGFPPNRSNNRKEWLLGLANEPRPLVVFEAPHRIRASLADVLEILGDREISVCRELTKIHETLVKGPISAVVPLLTGTKGEYTVIVSPGQNDVGPVCPPPSGAELFSKFGQMTKLGLSRRTAIRELATTHGMKSRAVYELLEREKVKVGETP